MASITAQPLQLQAAPNRFIQAHWYPSSTAAQAVIVMAPAMAVPQRFYQPFCTWLAAQGYHVLSFDYFGIGASTPQPLQQLHSSISEWAELDAAAVVRYLDSEFSTYPKLWLGHSISGQLFGMIPNHQVIHHMISVNTGSGYWRAMSGSFKWKSMLLWGLVTPLAVPLVGYFPGRKLGIIGDVPAAAMQQWRRWCLHPDYLVGAENLYQSYANVSTPITSLAVSDDEMIAPSRVNHLHDFYRHAPQQRILYHPHQFEVERLGHFAIFQQPQQALWPRLFGEPIQAALTAHSLR